MKKMGIIILFGIFICVLGGCEKKMTLEELEESVAQKKEDISLMKSQNENVSDPIKTLEIQDNREITIENDYIYIRGRVKNIGDTDITYYELVIEYIDDNKNILASEMTNNNIVLKPGAMQEFEVLRRYKEEYVQSNIYVSKVEY